MKKIIGLIIVVAVLALGYMLYQQSHDSAATPTPTETETMNNDTETMESDVSLEVAVDASAKTFDVSGVNFAFSESVIRVNEGDTVTINFQSEEGFHDWVIDEFDAATEQVRPGTITSVTFVADKVGTFEYYCSVGEHRAQGMIGNLIVE